MLENIRFADPFFLILLLIIPFFIWFDKNKKKNASIKYSSIQALKQAQGGEIFNLKFLLLLLRLLTITLFIISLARPQLSRASSEVLTEGISIVLNIDTSGSMAAIDLQINNDRATRLDVVKQVVKDFIKKRSYDPIGLVVFGTDAFTQCPLTLDYNILNDFMDNLEIGMAGEQTAIGDSIGLAVKRLKDAKAKSKIIILLTDGSNTAGNLDPVKAAEIAGTYGIKIYSIGVGTTGNVPFLQNTVFGPQIFHSRAEIDEKALQEIADKSNGKYYRAKNTEELQKIYNDIDKLEKTEVKVKKYLEYQELFLYFLLPGLLLLVLEIILANTRFIRIP
jgi:Ca-activated chloride channel family protein